MKRLHLECHSGVSGDMLLGALIDLGAPLSYLNQALDRLKLEGLKITCQIVSKSGIGASKAEVSFPDGLKLRHWRDVRDTLQRSSLSEFVKENSLETMKSIATVEAKIHGTDLERVHFHELGSPDTIVDVVGVFAAIEFLKPDQITSTPIAVGNGVVNIEHGVVPNPAPATLELLRDLPLDNAKLVGERTTPTGAAIISRLLNEQSDQITACAGEKIKGIGYGAGSADFPDRVNLLRAVMYESEPVSLLTDQVCQIEATIDDMNPQVFGYLFERLYKAGCLEAFIAPLTMKKSRPGWNLTVLCVPEKSRELSEMLLSESTTAGVRFSHKQRFVARREIIDIQTEFGTVSVKKLEIGNQIRFQPEYDSCLRLARKTKIPLLEIISSVQSATRSLSSQAGEDSANPAAVDAPENCIESESGV